MVWQEVARSLASREEKVYERIQDGMSTNAVHLPVYRCGASQLWRLY
jgi:hypothetical protein